MILANYFSPLNLNNLLILLVLVAGSDLIGHKMASLTKISNKFRPVFWMIGLWLITFGVFIGHLFVPISKQLVWIVFTLLSLASIYKSKYSLKGLLKFWPDFLIVGLLLIPFLKPLFFHISFPPRAWDTKAYHYLSPAQLKTQTTWPFMAEFKNKSIGFYSALPRQLELIDHLFFAATNTYATAQLIEVLMVISPLVILSKFLRSRGSIVASFVFVAIFLYFNTEVIFAATTGYIDALTGALAMLYLYALFEHLKFTSKSLLPLAIFFSLAAGAKYTILSFLAGSSIIFLIIIALQNRQLIKNFNQEFKKLDLHWLAKKASWMLLIFIIFGGAWYLKNLIVIGNPIYPFSLFCQDCSNGTQQLQGWGYLDFNWQNLSAISNFLFHSLIRLKQAFLVAIGLTFLLSIKFKNKHIFYAMAILVGGWMIEILLVRQAANFHLRFFYHWLYIIPLILAMPLVFLKKTYQAKSKWLTVVLLAYLFFTSQTIYSFVKQEQPTAYYLSEINDGDRWFARSKMSLLDWLKPEIPLMYPVVVDRCGQEQSMETLYTADPEIIWGKPGLTRVFLVNCRFHYISIVNNDIEQTAEKFEQEHPDDLLLSTHWCDPNNQELPENQEQLAYYKLNQLIVCGREETHPLLYQ